MLRLMEGVLHPLSRPLADAPFEDAAIEDEEVTAEEEQAVAEGREWLKHNKPFPHEEVLAQFGPTMADFERLGETPLPNAPNGSGR